MRVRTDTQTVIDKYGEPAEVYWMGAGLRKVRETRTPVLAINQGIGKLIGERIKAARVERGLSLASLATLAGLATPTPKQRMWSIENNVRQQGVSFGTLYAIAIALDMDVRDLMPTMAEIRQVADSKAVKETRVSLGRYYKP